MVCLEHASDGPHHINGLGFIRFLHFHYLKAPGQSRIAFEVLFVLGPGGGGNGAQFAPGQSGLEQVGGIALSLFTAGTDHGVRLVDKEDDRLGRGFDFGDDRLQTIFKLAFYAGSGLQQSQVQAAQHYILQRLGDITLGDPQRKTLHHGGFPDTGFAGQDGVVLSATDQDIDNLTDLLVPTPDWINFPIFGRLGEVDRVLVQTGCVAGLGGIGRNFVHPVFGR